MLASGKGGDVGPDKYSDTFGDSLLIGSGETNSLPSSESCVTSGDAVNVDNGELDKKSADASGRSGGEVDNCGTDGFVDEDVVEGGMLVDDVGDSERVPTGAADVDGSREVRGVVVRKSDDEVSGLASIDGRVNDSDANGMVIDGVPDTVVSTSVDVAGRPDESSDASRERDGVMKSNSLDESGYIDRAGVESVSVSFTDWVCSGRITDEIITGAEGTGSEKKAGDDMKGSVRFGGSVNFSNGMDDDVIVTPRGTMEVEGSSSIIGFLGVEETSAVITGGEKLTAPSFSTLDVNTGSGVSFSGNREMVVNRTMGVIIAEGITCGSSDASTLGDAATLIRNIDVEGVGSFDASTVIGEALMKEISPSCSNSLGSEVTSCELVDPKSSVTVDDSKAEES